MFEPPRLKHSNTTTPGGEAGKGFLTNSSAIRARLIVLQVFYRLEDLKDLPTITTLEVVLRHLDLLAWLSVESLES